MQYVKLWLQFQWYVKIKQDLIRGHSPRIAQRNKKTPMWRRCVWSYSLIFSIFECKVRMVKNGTYAHELHLWSVQAMWWNILGSTFFQPSNLMFSTHLIFSTLSPGFVSRLVWQPFLLCYCNAWLYFCWQFHLICFIPFLLSARSRIPERRGEGRFQGAPCILTCRHLACLDLAWLACSCMSWLPWLDWLALNCLTWLRWLDLLVGQAWLDLLDLPVLTWLT